MKTLEHNAILSCSLVMNAILPALCASNEAAPAYEAGAASPEATK